MTSGASSSKISVSRGSTYFAPSMRACQVGRDELAELLERRLAEDRRRVADEVDPELARDLVGSAGGGPEPHQPLLEALRLEGAGERLLDDEHDRWPRRRRTLPMPTQLLVGPKAPSGKKTIVRPSATSSTLVLARRTVPSGSGWERTWRHRSHSASDRHRHSPARRPDRRDAERHYAIGRIGPFADVPGGYVPPKGDRPWESRDADHQPADERRYTVADFMTIEPVVIRPDARIEDAEGLLERYDISGLPVVDEDGTLRGWSTRATSCAGRAASTADPGRRFTGLRVADLMSSPAITVDLEMRLVDAARLMRDEKVHRVVAVDASRRAVGVLSSMDFVTLYAER